ncbi:MAG: sigma-70 family RNA polymerase sigma factor [Xanthomonadales bacterium]|nr:sigma-70 family RNA polymerase sigma factor [Xanthomonadales bacterium]
MEDITSLIGMAREGDKPAAERLFALLYEELRRLARRQVNGPDPPMHATSLVHEAYFRLAREGALAVNDREHFYALAARVMRQIMLNAVRARGAARRGGGLRVEALDTQALRVIAGDELGEHVLELDAALAKLASLEPALERLVELRFFAGLELAEIAVLLDRSERSLKRDWRRARAFLYAEIAGRPEDAGPPPA